MEGLGNTPGYLRLDLLVTNSSNNICQGVARNEFLNVLRKDVLGFPRKVFFDVFPNDLRLLEDLIDVVVSIAIVILRRSIPPG